MAITFSNIGMEEPSTITNRASAVTINRGGTDEQQEILVIGDPESSVAIARVLAATPASTEYGLAVREIVPQSTGPFAISSVGGVVAVSTGPVQVSSVGGVVQVSTGPFQISSIQGVVSVSTGPFVISSIVGVVSVSTGPVQISSVGGVVAVSTGPSLSRVTDRDQSTAVAAVLGSGAPASTTFGLVVRVAEPSTGPFQISSIQGVVSVSTGPFVISSIQGVVSVSTGPFVISSIQGVVSVSTGPFVVSSITGRTLVAQNSTVWEVQPGANHFDSTYASGTKASSGDTTLISSGASTRIAVFGYQFSLASTTPTTVRLMNGSTAEMARWFFQGPSSVSIGANMAVSMPGFLYRTAASNPLILNTDSTATVHYTVMAYRMS